ncbi:MAG: hypothetical protein JNK15_09010 [Planctomycetes bacterium]|nr:hypothetical protein [Planctomycetota bacterium]
MKSALSWIVVFSWFAVAMLPAQARNDRAATVGMRGVIEQVVLPGSELEPAPSTAKTPVVLRVLQTWPHGEHLRYDLEWSGLEPGQHDLAKYLVRKDGSPLGELPPLVVDVTSVLAKGAAEPSEPDPVACERLGGYSMLQWTVGTAWVLGLLAILFVGRDFRRRRTEAKVEPTLADRLRPLVERIAAGGGDDAAKAELERLLVAFWRARLGLHGHKAGDAIVAIKEHAEAGALLRQLEAWLHMPKPPAAVDVQALLDPYRAVTAASFAPIVPPPEGA